MRSILECFGQSRLLIFDLNLDMREPNIGLCPRGPLTMPYP